MSSFALIFAQATNAAAGAAASGTSSAASDAPQQGAPGYTMLLYMVVFGAAFYFLIFRPQQLQKKQLEEKIKSAKTGDKIVTSSGIHGLITNVKDTTVIVKVAGTAYNVVNPYKCYTSYTIKS